MGVNEKRVLRVMRNLNLLVTNYHHKSRKYNSYRGYVGRVAKHLIRRRFETILVHQKITTDTTEIIMTVSFATHRLQNIVFFQFICVLIHLIGPPLIRMKGTTKEAIRGNTDGLIQSSHNRLGTRWFRKAVSNGILSHEA